MDAPLELVYKSIDGFELSLDVFLPESATETSKVPVFLWWHGGGLLQGTRKGTSPHHLSAPAKHSLCIVAADYRLAPQTRLPGILADCKAAMDFVRSPAFAQATGNCVDASKMVVSGSSAGIAALYPISDLADPFWTTKQHPKVSYMPRVILDEEVAPFIDPAADAVGSSAPESKRSIFYHYMVQEALLESLLLDGTGVSALAVGVAPALKTGKFTVPPTYIIHGDIDDKVPIGADVQYEELPGVNHLFDKDPTCEMKDMYAFVTRVTKS
ncbi:Alpha/Beta hydrolase protein [Mycena galopus ATCC 62051]|nr:Alpha/Beta hydrolase protein [Mycena galopus ATCC 62051]